MYKFYPLSEYMIKNLEANQLWFNQPCSFNDPFDCLFELDLDDYDAFKAKAVDYLCERKDSDHLEKIFPVRPSKDDFSRYLANKDWLLGVVEKAVTLIRKKLGVVCFCSDRSALGNILMWSHYADSHKGICVEFEDSILLDHMTNQGVTHDRVKYLENKDMETPLPFEDGEALTRKVIFQKLISWDYEVEYRAVKKNPQAVKYPSHTPTTGFSFQLPSNCIKAVYLGCNWPDITTLDDQYEMRAKLFAITGKNNIDIFRMVPEKRAFTLEPQKYLTI